MNLYTSCSRKVSKEFLRKDLLKFIRNYAVRCDKYIDRATTICAYHSRRDIDLFVANLRNDFDNHKEYPLINYNLSIFSTYLEKQFPLLEGY